MLKRRLLIVLALLVAVGVIAAALVYAAPQPWSHPQNGGTDEPPKGKAQAGVVRFVALGDMGTGSSEQFAIASQMAKYHDARPYDIVLMLGDNIYGDGDPAKLPERFERPYAELLRRGVDFYAVFGNHDVQIGRAGQMNYKPFHMEGRAYYSFVKGNGLVEFFALDSTKMDAAQLRWLEGALTSSKARWKIAYFHHPIYSSGKKHGSDKKLRALVEPLFVRYGVAAVFSGHDHIYERTRPQQGVQYFVSGAGGKLRRGDINRQSPFFAAGDDDVNSFMYVELTRDRFAFWSVDATGRILDGGVLAQPRASAQR